MRDDEEGNWNIPFLKFRKSVFNETQPTIIRGHDYPSRFRRRRAQFIGAYRFRPSQQMIHLPCEALPMCSAHLMVVDRDGGAGRRRSQQPLDETEDFTNNVNNKAEYNLDYAPCRVSYVSQPNLLQFIHHAGLRRHRTH